MVPVSIRNNLAGLRRRERLLTFVWGAACWLSIVLVLLFVCGLVDWLIDRQRDTPRAVRLGMFFAQTAVAAVAGLFFLLWPQVRRLPDALLALWVEEKIPRFDHRLISAVQLNQPEAQLEGMSRELVAVVTREAEKETQRLGGFTQVADHSRLRWAAFVLTPIVLLVALPFAIWPGLCFALLVRQALSDVEVPHSVTLVSLSQEYWPIGEKIKLYFRVTGDWNENMEGTLWVTPQGQPTDRYPLTFSAEDEIGAIFEADVPPSAVNIRYSARLVDGRSKLPSEMQLVPRPIVNKNLAWVLLPAYCGLRPARPGLTVDERRYENAQGGGDVVGIPGSSVRVQVIVQKHIAAAEIELLRSKKTLEGAAPAAEDATGERKKMTLGSDRMSAEVRFDLIEGLTGYRVIVRDIYGFENVPAPRRTLRVIPEEPPQVVLLRDTFGVGGDFDVEGMPVRLGKKIRVPYACFGAYGLGKAQLLYRVLKVHESGNEPVEEEKWVRLNLPEEHADDAAGPFDPKTGVFKSTPFYKSVSFHAVPSIDENTTLGRTVGGGRAFLDTSGLRDSKGPLQLKSGDKIEYCVKVYAADRAPSDSTPFAVSETRVSTVLSDKEFDAWLAQLGEEDKRVKQLEAKQKGVFEPK
jgi:hypothetical protein